MYTEKLNEINELFSKRKQKFVLLGTFLFILIGATGYILQSGIFFPIYIDDVIVIQILTIPFMIGAIAFTISAPALTYKKIITQHLMPLLIQELKIEYPALTFEGKHKDRSFNEVGGLFWRKNSVTVHYKIRTETFLCMRCIMSHSNGKSQTIDFDGIYYVLPYSYPKLVQIRSSGRPFIHRVKLTKITKEKPKYYAETESELIDSNLLSLYNSILRNTEAKRLYLATTNSELHIAIRSPKLNYPKIKKVSYQEVEQLKQWLEYQLQLGQELQSLISFH